MPERSGHDHTLLILCVAVFIFSSPFTTWWSSFTLPWYAMFIVWALIILLVAVNQRNRRRNGD
ncbi:MAG: hypothetical protein V3U65_14615 [Granulosicoccaceae bacterium]